MPNDEESMCHEKKQGEKRMSDKPVKYKLCSMKLRPRGLTKKVFAINIFEF